MPAGGISACAISRRPSWCASYLRGSIGADELMSRFGEAASSDFTPERDLQRIGLANQTTMLMSETLKVQELLRRAMVDRYGEADLASRFRAFDTICSATQERQDAVLDMLAAGGLDLMIVIGGYNSSNTQALAKMCAPRLQTYHIDSPACIDPAGIRHRAIGSHDETQTPGWLADGDVRIGITAGASTPDSVVGEVIERLLALRGQGGRRFDAAGRDRTRFVHLRQGFFAKRRTSRATHDWDPSDGTDADPGAAAPLRGHRREPSHCRRGRRHPAPAPPRAVRVVSHHGRVSRSEPVGAAASSPRPGVAVLPRLPCAVSAGRRIPARSDAPAQRAHRRAEGGRAEERRFAPDLHRRRHAQLRDLSLASGCAGVFHRARRQDRRDAAPAQDHRGRLRPRRDRGADVDHHSDVEAPDRFGQPRRSAARAARAGQRDPRPRRRRTGARRSGGRSVGTERRSDGQRVRDAC